MKIAIFDVECDGFNPTKIHVLSAAIFSEGEWRLKSTTDYDEMRKFFSMYDVYIGHNIIRFDIPVVEKILNIKVVGKYADTLGVSWYLYPKKLIHGLADWGEYFGIPKPKIEEGEWMGPLPGETFEEFIAKMTHRCEEDVKINCKLWDKQFKDLLNLYDNNQDEVWRLVDYLSFKLDCARAAEASKWRIDKVRAMEGYLDLSTRLEDKYEALKLVMPKNKKYSTRKPSAKRIKADGTYYSSYQNWLNFLDAQELPEDHNEPVKYLSHEEDPKPSSPSQVKSWLFDLGWVPETFDFKRNKETGETRQIPQIRVDNGEGKELCSSILKLIDIEPDLQLFDDVTVLKHRSDILKGWIEFAGEGEYVKAQISGLTNTLRFKHKTIVNLPGVRKPYGELIRGCLIAPEGYELCGSDMSSLEDRTKQHYMWKHDPDYVKTMLQDDFDPHLNIAVQGEFITQEDSDFYKWVKEQESLEKGGKPFTPITAEHKTRYKAIDAERHKGKTTNYSATYGAGGATIARAAKIAVTAGQVLHKAYWDVNWALNTIAEEAKVKDCLGGKWIFNPVSKLWYSLRRDKDKFSTLNQGTGVFCFDTWIMYFREKRPELTGQMHDEVILCVKKGHREGCEKLLRDAINATNKQLNLNRELDIDVAFGDNYAQIH